MRVTIYDIAEKAGVSIGTVSRVLNSDPNVAPKTRSHVMQVMKRCGYQPSKLARGLARGSTNSIAVLVSLGLSMVDVAEIQGIHDAALSMDYDILIHDVTNKPFQSSVARVIGGQRVDALLGLHLYDITDDEVATISESEIPFVLVGVARDDTNYVVTDDALGAYMATKHLLDLGYRRIALIRGPMSWPVTVNRLRGYQRALDETGVSLDPAIVFESEYSRDGGCEAMNELLRSASLDKVDAIFCMSDDQAFGVLDVAKHTGIRIPDDVALMGYDDLTPASIVALSTVRRPFYDMGKAAVRLVFSECEPGQRQHVLFEPQLVIRETCGAYQRMSKTV
jgi:LacI family transcriptional regulator